MDFLKKNYIKIIISVIMLAAATLFIVLLAQYKASYHDLVNQFDPSKSGADAKYASSYLFSYIAAFSVFTLAAAFVIMSMFDKTKSISKWAMCVAGTVGTICMCIALIGVAGSKSSDYANEIKSGKYDTTIEQAVTAGVSATVASNVAAAISQSTGGAVSAADVPTNSATADAYQGAYEAQMASAEIRGTIAAVTKEKVELAKSTASYQTMSYLTTLISMFIGFGLLPLGYGLKKVLKRS